MKPNVDSVIAIVLVACALLTTAAVVKRAFVARPAANQEGGQSAVYIKDWRANQAAGTFFANPDAPVQLLEFADFECPFCGNFHHSLKVIQSRYSDRIALTYVHFPIPGHRFALPAARAAECAGNQGRFAAMYDQLFDGQDQFGLKPWNEYATAAGVPDIAAFDACIKRTDPIPRVEEGKSLGAKLDVKGTPTIIINGWKLGHPPTDQELDQMVQRILAGKQPVDDKS